MSEKCKHNTLKEKIKTYLYDAIVSGEMKPGQRIKIIPLATAFNTSQAPVREAIQCLATGGYLELIPNVGARVRELSAKDVHEIYMVREALEAAGLRASGNARPDLLELLEKEIQRMRRAAEKDDFGDYARHNTCFHRHLVSFAENTRMLALWDGLHIPRIVTFTLKSVNMSLREAVDIHYPIIQGLKENNPEKAIQGIYFHYQQLGREEPHGASPHNQTEG